MIVNVPRLVIGAPSSGSGKTTVSAGLMAALAEQRNVQGFKVGPDYIDPGYHSYATGNPSRNLDSWMVSLSGVQEIFARACQNADLAIIEGVMGLFDGYQGLTEEGSTAQVAKLLGSPVILVMDAAKMARSAGAVALGCKMFDLQLDLAGVIVNNTASSRHALWVRQAVESAGLPVLGCLPRNQDLCVPERHLGLYTSEERAASTRQFIEVARAVVQKEVDIGAVLEIARRAAPLEVNLSVPLSHPTGQVRIAVARDEAFSFYYEDNLDLLRNYGAEIIYFSPLRDARLPENIQGLYLGGGYPELYASRISANRTMMAEIRRVVRENMPVYAECGGLMVLTEGLQDTEGVMHGMAGVIPGYAQMAKRLTLGYREGKACRSSLLFEAGDTLRGHEFHYSQWVVPENSVPEAYEIKPRSDVASRMEGIASGNLLASYVHLHFASDPKMAERYVDACHRWGKGY